MNLSRVFVLVAIGASVVSCSGSTPVALPKGPSATSTNRAPGSEPPPEAPRSSTSSSTPSAPSTTTSSGGGSTVLDSLPDQGAGVVAWRLDDSTDQDGSGHLFRQRLAGGAQREDVSAALDRLSPLPSGGKDRGIAISPDGSTFLVETNRFGCGDTACMVVLPSDLSSGQVVSASLEGSIVASEGPPAVGDHGDVVVFSSGTGPHSVDLWLVRRSGAAWGTPALVTGKSPAEYNDAPRLARDGSRIVFDCGPTPYSQDGTNVCGVDLAGGAVETLAPTPRSDGFAKTGSLTNDGALIYEGCCDGGELLWRIPRGGAASAINRSFGNDNSPCVLASGWIASLWLGREGNRTGRHELKVMAPDGTRYAMVDIDHEIADTGLACGG